MISKVTRIIDGDTFEIHLGWKWRGQSGRRVRPAGYDAPELGSIAGLVAKNRLARLVLNKPVELKNARTIDRGRLVCDVYVGGRDLADHW